jgi:hypothetical protein
LVHSPGYYCGIVEIRIITIIVLEGPATSFEVRMLLLPVSGLI